MSEHVEGSLPTLYSHGPQFLVCRPPGSFNFDNGSPLVLLNCRVEMWRGGLGLAYPFPALSSAGASLSGPYSVSTSRSSNRTCGFPASGSRRKHHGFAHEKLRFR